MNKLRIGILGCAAIARRSAIPALLELPQLFELAAVASRTPEKAAVMAAEFNTEPVTGYENLLADTNIDAVYMPLPTGLHEEWITKALLCGKHVFCEKSLALNRQSAERICNLAREKGLLVMENFMFRYHSQHQQVKQFIADGSLGKIRLFTSQFGFPPLEENNFRYDPVSAGGGSLLDAGAYTLRAASWFLGPTAKVTAATLYMDGRRDTDIYGNATLINQEGIAAQLSFGFDNFYQCNYAFWGSKAKLTAQKAFTPKPAEQPALVVEEPGNTEVRKLEPDHQFLKIWQEFHRSILVHDHEEHLNDISLQSSLLDQVSDQAIKIYL